LFKGILKLLSRIFLAIILIAVLLTVLLYYSRQIEPYLLVVKRVPIEIANLPPGMEGLRIVQISDLHGKEFRDNRLVQKVNSLEPDILVITGDVIDRYHPDYSYIERVLGPMRVRLGKFMVCGNNEYSFNLSTERMDRSYHKAKVTVLHNRSHRIDYRNDHLWLVGVDDPNKGRDDLNLALKGTDGAPKILLAHSPEIIDKAKACKIDLVLAGHTHGGQVNIPGISQKPEVKYKIDKFLEQVDREVRVILPETKFAGKAEEEINVSKAGKLLEGNMKPGFEKYVSGLYSLGVTQMYVNRGLGETRAPYRLFAPPEITEFELRKK